MTLYEIDHAIAEAFEAAIDPETGEITDSDAWAELESLQMARETKLEGIGCWIKDLLAEASAIKTEEEALKKRRQSSEKKAESLKGYLAWTLEGQNFKTPKVAVSWRKSRAVEIDEAVFWKNPAECFVRYGKPTADKKAITAALKDGGIVPGAALVEKVSMTIK